MASNLIMIGFTLILLTWVMYLAAIPREKVPARPVLHVVVMVFGLIAMVTGLSNSLNFLSAAVAIVGIGMAVLFFFLLTIARLPDGELRVAVGDSMLAFTAPDSSGRTVNADDWRGQRILLKFFRGKW